MGDCYHYFSINRGFVTLADDAFAAFSLDVLREGHLEYKVGLASCNASNCEFTVLVANQTRLDLLTDNPQAVEFNMSVLLMVDAC